MGWLSKTLMGASAIGAGAVAGSVAGRAADPRGRAATAPDGATDAGTAAAADGEVEDGDGDRDRIIDLRTDIAPLQSTAAGEEPLRGKAVGREAGGEEAGGEEAVGLDVGDEVDAERGRAAAGPDEFTSTAWRDVGKRVVAEIKRDHVPVIAAGVAFYAWIALIPALLAMVMVYGLVASPDQVTDQISDLTSGLSPEASETLLQVVASATGANSRGLSIGLAIALAGVLWTASGGMDGLIKGINIAYDEEPRSFPRRRGLAILLSLGAIVASVVAVGLLTAFPVAMENLGLSGAARIGAQVARWVLLTVLTMVGLAVLYRLAPNRADPRWQWISPGAVLATVLWLIGSIGFAVYVQMFGSYNETYGTLGGIIVLNLWLFLTSFVILLGAEVNAETEAQTARDTTTGEPRPMGERGAVKADRLGPVPD